MINNNENRPPTFGGIGSNTKLLKHNGESVEIDKMKQLEKLYSNESSTFSNYKNSKYLYRIKLENKEYYDVAHGQQLVLTLDDNKDIKHYLTVQDCCRFPPSILSKFRVCKGLGSWESKKTLINPFVLGCWLGSLNVDSIGFNVTRQKYTKIKSWLNLFEIDYNSNLQEDKQIYVNFSDNFEKSLKKYNLYFQNRFIPQSYRFNDSETRTNILRGYINTAKCFSQGKVFYLRYENKVIARDIVFIARSLGYKAHIKGNRIVVNVVPSTKYKFSVYPLGKSDCVSLKNNDNNRNKRCVILTEAFDQIIVNN